MALGEFKLFQFKSRKQKEIEEQEYAVWAFPYGDTQRERLCELIRLLYPKASIPIYLAAFLTCKELYERELKDSESDEETVEKMINVVKDYGQLIRKSEMPMYLALVLADADVDENCEYPSAEEIQAKILELTDMKKENKKPRKKLFEKK